jgi:hypothetical protein
MQAGVMPEATVCKFAFLVVPSHYNLLQTHVLEVPDGLITAILEPLVRFDTARRVHSLASLSYRRMLYMSEQRWSTWNPDPQAADIMAIEGLSVLRCTARVR